MASRGEFYHFTSAAIWCFSELTFIWNISINHFKILCAQVHEFGAHMLTVAVCFSVNETTVILKFFI
jgi:hypothetical protein